MLSVCSDGGGKEMSQRFFFNDCLPAQAANGVNVISLFRDMVIGFRALHQNKTIDVDQNWTMSGTVDGVTICGVTLRAILGQLKAERDLYSYASRLVTNSMPIIYEEDQMMDDAETGLDFRCCGRDAHCLLLAQKMNMIAATLPVEQALCADMLNLIYTDPNTGNQTIKKIINWYVANSGYIVNLLTPPLPSPDDPWNRLMAILGQHGKVVCSKSFEKDWKGLGSDLQQLVVGRFEDALNAGLLYPANNHNMGIVKPDQKDKTSKVHELRQKGTGFRVYFECDEDVIYIALYASKTIHHGANQEADFRIAKSIVARLRKGIDS